METNKQPMLVTVTGHGRNNVLVNLLYCDDGLDSSPMKDMQYGVGLLDNKTGHLQMVTQLTGNEYNLDTLELHVSVQACLNRYGTASKNSEAMKKKYSKDYPGLEKLDYVPDEYFLVNQKN